MHQPPQPVFFNAGPGPKGIQTQKGVLNKFKRRAMKRCRARVDPETRSLLAVLILRQSPVQRGGQGDRRIYPSHKDREAGLPRTAGPDKLRSLRLTMGLTIMYVEDDGRQVDLMSRWRRCEGGSRRSVLPRTPGAAPGA